MSIKLYTVFFIAVLGYLALVSGGTPATTVLLQFVEDIEKIPGGGDFLGELIQNPKGVTEKQLKQVTTLMPLIDARQGKSDEGFIHMLSVLDSSPARRYLLQRTIGFLANISNTKITALDNLVPLASGQVNASHGAALIGDFLDGQVGIDVLLGIIGPNKTIQVHRFLPAVSELLHSGSTIGAVQSLVTFGTKANTVLLKLIGKVGDPALVKAVEDILPFVESVLDQSIETSNNTIDLLSQLNFNLQNDTIRGNLGAGFTMLTASALNGAFGFLSRHEIIPNLNNVTISHPPLEGLVSLIGGLNASLVQKALGNNSFTDFVTDSIDHSGSQEELSRFIIEERNELLSKPTTSEHFGDILARGSVYILSEALRPHVEVMTSANTSTSSPPTPSKQSTVTTTPKSGSTKQKGSLVKLEESKLQVLQQLLTVETQRLAVEIDRLAVERDRLTLVRFAVERERLAVERDRLTLERHRLEMKEHMLNLSHL